MRLFAQYKNRFKSLSYLHISQGFCKTLKSPQVYRYNISFLNILKSLNLSFEILILLYLFIFLVSYYLVPRFCRICSYCCLLLFYRQKQYLVFFPHCIFLLYCIFMSHISLWFTFSDAFWGWCRYHFQVLLKPQTNDPPITNPPIHQHFDHLSTNLGKISRTDSKYVSNSLILKKFNTYFFFLKILIFIYCLFLLKK